MKNVHKIHSRSCSGGVEWHWSSRWREVWIQGRLWEITLGFDLLSFWHYIFDFGFVMFQIESGVLGAYLYCDCSFPPTSVQRSFCTRMRMILMNRMKLILWRNTAERRKHISKRHFFNIRKIRICDFAKQQNMSWWF